MGKNVLDVLVARMAVLAQGIAPNALPSVIARTMRQSDGLNDIEGCGNRLTCVMRVNRFSYAYSFVLTHIV